MVTLKLLYPARMPPHSTLTDGFPSCHFACTSPAGTHVTLRRRGNPTPTASPAPERLSDLYGPTLSSSQLLDSLLRFICIFCPTSQEHLSPPLPTSRPESARDLLRCSLPAPSGPDREVSCCKFNAIPDLFPKTAGEPHMAGS